MTDVLVITGLSGAGRSQAADDLEDLGWFVLETFAATIPASAMPVGAIDAARAVA